MKRKSAQQRRATLRGTRIKTILVPIDFSSASLEPIQWAKFIARKTNADIHFVHVHDFAWPLATAITPPLVGSETEIEQRLLRDLQAVVSKCGVGGAKANCYVLTGRPFHEICKLAAGINADLIAISTQGRTDWERVLIGSTAERIIRHAPCPVLVVRQSRAKKKTEPKLKKILAPVDFSDCSAKGLNYAVGLAQLFAAEMVLLNTFQIYHDLPRAVIYSETRLIRWAREIAEAHMSDLVEATNFGGVKFETAIKKGPAAQTIDRFAYKIAADLIVTATHGWTGLPHVFIGSTAEQIVRYAKSAVLVVPTRKRALAKILKKSAIAARHL